jgi:D-alanyl-D-alanine carboxypeptidase
LSLGRVIGAVCSVACAAICPAASPSDSAYQDLIEGAVKKGVPGVQAHVRRGELRWSGSAGASSVETKTAMTLTRPIRLASLTKMMTYAAVIELVKQNRLALSDRAIDLLPPATLGGIPYAGDITVNHLLEHKSGLHNFNGEDGADFFRDLFNDPNRGARRWTPLELVAYAKKSEHKPTGRPGERFAYSSTGYMVLQMILEQIEKKPLNEIYRALLFEPLQMNATGVEGTDFTTNEIADSYARPSLSDSVRPSPFAGRKRIRADGLTNLSAGLRYYNAWAQSAGAAAAPVTDLERFMDAVIAGRVEVLSDQRAQFERSKSNPDRRFSWNGGSWGVQASILCEPASDITTIVLLNASNAGGTSHEIALDLLKAARRRD